MGVNVCAGVLQFAAGSVVPLDLEYQLVSAKNASLVVALMDWDWVRTTL